MTKTYIVLDDTLGEWVGMSSDMITAVIDARDYYEHTKNEVHIYLAELVGEFKGEELQV